MKHLIRKPMLPVLLLAVIVFGTAFMTFFRADIAAGWAQIDRLYAEYYYPFHNKKPEKLREYGEEQAVELAALAGKYGFTDICHALFYRTRSFTAPEYVALLGTYSDHIALEESVRTAFFREIERAIHRHGGTLTVYDTIDLQLARKP